MNKSKYRLIHLITGLNTGGAEMVLYRLLTQLNRDKFDSMVISLTDIGPVGEKIKDLNIPVVGLGMKRGIPNPLFLWKLIRMLKQLHPDLLQTWMYHANLMGLLAGRWASIKHIIWGIHSYNLHPDVEKKQTIFVARLAGRLSPLTSQIIYCSQAAVRTHAQLGYHPEKVVVIPNGFDLDLFKPNKQNKFLLQELSLSHDSLLVGHVARWHPQKDHLNLIRAAQIVIKHLPQVHFVLCGDGITPSNEVLWASIQQAGIQHQVHLLGRRNDIHLLMPQFDVYVSSSKGEAFPNALGEAMACEVPCITTDVGDSAYIVGDTGFVVPPQDPQALANAIIQYFRTPLEQRQQLGRKARQRVETHFTLAQTVKQYEQVYESLLCQA